MSRWIKPAWFVLCLCGLALALLGPDDYAIDRVFIFTMVPTAPAGIVVVPLFGAVVFPTEIADVARRAPRGQL